MDDVVKITDQMDGYVIETNSDRTEGKGRKLIIHHTFYRTTALRLAEGKGIQGSNAHVAKVPFVKIEGEWYAPVTIDRPTNEDRRLHEVEMEKERVLNLAKKLGLTDNDIEILKKS